MGIGSSLLQRIQGNARRVFQGTRKKFWILRVFVEKRNV